MSIQEAEEEIDSSPIPLHSVEWIGHDVLFISSGDRLGYVLMQQGRVIAFGSRQLKIHKKNYSMHDLELEAMIHALKS